MPYKGLADFITFLDKSGDLNRIKTFVDPLLEIAEITDRIVKNNGSALLFENNGTKFPVLMNAFGSEFRMAAALGKKTLGEAAGETASIIENISGMKGSLLAKLRSLPKLARISGYLPSRIAGKGRCQKVIYKDPDLTMLPVLKCWPHDSGRFITLPMVHTRNPVTGSTNVGMYRMQVLDSKTTAMHWQRHKTGANHFIAWKEKGEIMPVSVALGGDPVYTWASTAPLPENIDEYILAGFIRKKKVKLARCITNDLWIPADADIVIEGYVDPSEDMVWEGPFGDHTGFYSLADWYPKFHVTCITHAEKAVYPATIVGIPPHEDALMAKATEMIFLAPLKLAVQQEVIDFHMPDAGVAHNLVIVKIKKSYPGQGKKVISSLFGAGQMMFTKYLAVVSGEIDIRDYSILISHVLENTDFRTDLLFASGPLDVLDHSSDIGSLGGKLGIDATIKLPEELTGRNTHFTAGGERLQDYRIVKKGDMLHDKSNVKDIARLILCVDDAVVTDDLFMVAWQILGNSDPVRDIEYLSGRSVFVDGTIKAFRKGGFPRKWPNVVCSSGEIISRVDGKWDSLELGALIPSPSSKYSRLVLEGDAEVRAGD